ncbi:hypothetical protein [Pseudomonas nitroreducens]|uniref:hypothetical protein n=1 Tax=Pseudomonas nitroreducens TaxID=46680 RepID=UPI001E2BC0E4|nr:MULTISPECIES: hypothetical protein [Pseudomonas]MCE4073331.1 hypothetical protein [Pseudomonas nitritireducens]MCE4079627.1 hypothetical protein [Pseudomonas nitroreducens]
MDIQIDRPVVFSMDILEFDEHVPSIKASIRLGVAKFNYSLSVDAVIWFECAEFDRFIGSLKVKRLSVFSDIERNFELEVDFSGRSFSWVFSKKGLDGRLTSAKGSESIMDDELSCLVNSFSNYPKWW